MLQAVGDSGTVRRQALANLEGPLLDLLRFVEPALEPQDVAQFGERAGNLQALPLTRFQRGTVAGLGLRELSGVLPALRLRLQLRDLGLRIRQEERNQEERFHFQSPKSWKAAQKKGAEASISSFCPLAVVIS